MTTERLHQLHADESSKLHAVLMGAAGSGIAFALHETSDWRLGNPLWMVLAAIGAWALSFASGIVSRHKLLSAVRSNLLIFEARRLQTAVGVAESERAANRHNKLSLRFQDAQQMLLLIGVVAYLAGHILHLVAAEQVTAGFALPPATQATARPQ